MSCHWAGGTRGFGDRLAGSAFELGATWFCIICHLARGACHLHKPLTPRGTAAPLIECWALCKNTLLFVWFYISFKVGINYRWFEGCKVKGPLLPGPLPKGTMLAPSVAVQKVCACTSR